MKSSYLPRNVNNCLCYKTAVSFLKHSLPKKARSNLSEPENSDSS